MLERTNARYLSRAQVPDPLDFASVDVSFISLKLIFPALHDLLRERGQVVSLIKPQFEAGREFVGKKGIVRDPKVHRMVLEQYLEHAEAADFSVLDLTYSPITGQEGNIEYLGFLEKGAGPVSYTHLVGAVYRVTNAAKKMYPGLPVLCSGGVASNSVLRSVLQDAVFALPEYSRDNAMGIAVLACRVWESREAQR